MQFFNITRADFLSVIAGLRFERRLLDDGDITIATTIQDSRLVIPQAIFVHGVEVEEFLAWGHAYLPLPQPLTSQMHVLPASLLPWFKQESSNRPSVLPLAGAIVARDMFMGSVTPTSLAFAIGVANAIGLDKSWCEQIVRRWSRIQDVFDYHSSTTTVREEIEDFWKFVNVQQSSTWTAITQALTTITEQRELSPRNIEQLLGFELDLSKINRIRVSRDEKLIAINVIIDQLKTSDAPRANRSFVIGYAMCRLALGSVEYAHLLAHQQVPIACALWYGYLSLFCADPVDSPTSPAVQTTAQRLVKARDLSAFPTCHYSYEELEIMTRTSMPVSSMASADTHRIEIAPFTTVWVSQRDEEGDAPPAPEMLGEVSRLLRRSLELVEGFGGPLNKRPKKRRRN